MNTFDRRRIVAATLFTVLALITLWVVGRSAPATGATAPDPAATRPPTTPYVPERPVFIGGDTSGTAFASGRLSLPPDLLGGPYSLLLSPNVSFDSAVPEPGSIGLALMGLSLAAVVVRNRVN